MKEKRAEKATPGKACKQGLRQWEMTSPTSVGHGSYTRGARVLLPWSTGPTSVEHGSYFRGARVLLPSMAGSATDSGKFCSGSVLLAGLLPFLPRFLSKRKTFK